MENLIAKIKLIRDEMSQKHGDFRLFGLFLKDTSVNSWDLVISSDWACGNEKDAIKEISRLLSERLSKSEIVKINAVFVVPANTPAMEALRGLTGQMKDSRITGCNINGIEIKDAYILDYDPTK